MGSSRAKAVSSKAKRLTAGQSKADFGTRSEEEPKRDPFKTLREDETPSPATPQPFDAAAGLVTLAEVAIGVAVTAAAARKHVSPDTVRKAQKLTEDERSLLGVLSPMAAPYFQTFSEKAPLAGAIGFGLAVAYFAASRMRDLRVEHERTVKKSRGPRGMAADKPEAQPEPPTTWQDIVKRDNAGAYQTAGSGTGAHKVAHDQAWQSAADAVPVGTLPREVGFRRKFQPEDPEEAA